MMTDVVIPDFTPSRVSTNQMLPQPPSGPKPKAKIKMDPLLALEPARKKLSTLESQRIMAVLAETIRRSELLTILPFVLDNLERFKVVLGVDLVKQMEEHKVIVQSFQELKTSTDDLVAQENALRSSSADSGDEEERDMRRKEDAQKLATLERQIAQSMNNLNLVAQQMQHSCKTILRQLDANPAATSAILKEQEQRDRTKEAQDLLGDMHALKDIIMERLLTTPVEEKERNDYLKEITQREKDNNANISKLQKELDSATDDKNHEVKKKNDVIRTLQAELNQRETFSMETVKRIKSESEKQEASDVKNSEGKRMKQQHEINALRNQLSSQINEHRDSEQALRKRKFKIETEVENWIQKFDQDMGERHTEYERIDKVYTKEKKDLNELEERFKTLEAEYTQIMEEKRIARETREARERELAASVSASTIIQAFWRSYKVRKALKAKKKKKGGGGKKKK